MFFDGFGLAPVALLAVCVVGGGVSVGLCDLRGLLGDGLRARLQPRLNALVLSVEVGKIRNKILNNLQVGERVDFGVLVVVSDLGEAGKVVAAVNVHGAGTADTCQNDRWNPAISQHHLFTKCTHSRGECGARTALDYYLHGRNGGK